MIEKPFNTTASDDAADSINTTNQYNHQLTIDAWESSIEPKAIDPATLYKMKTYGDALPLRTARTTVVLE